MTTREAFENVDTVCRGVGGFTIAQAQNMVTSLEMLHDLVLVIERQEAAAEKAKAAAQVEEQADKIEAPTKPAAKKGLT